MQIWRCGTVTLVVVEAPTGTVEIRMCIDIHIDVYRYRYIMHPNLCLIYIYIYVCMPYIHIYICVCALYHIYIYVKDKAAKGYSMICTFHKTRRPIATMRRLVTWCARLYLLAACEDCAMRWLQPAKHHRLGVVNLKTDRPT